MTQGQLQSLKGRDVVIIFQNICVFTTRYLTANPLHTMLHFHTWHTFRVFLETNSYLCVSGEIICGIWSPFTLENFDKFDQFIARQRKMLPLLKKSFPTQGFLGCIVVQRRIKNSVILFGITLTLCNDRSKGSITALLKTKDNFEVNTN